MKNLYLLMVAFLLIVSCKKEDDRDPVNPDDFRVYTATAYHNNGNIFSLQRFSYSESGMLKREVVFYIGDSLSSDTTNVMKHYTDYLMQDDTTLLVLIYSIEPGHTTGTGTTRWQLNGDGLAIRSFRSGPIEQGLTGYTLFTKAFDQEGYCTINRSIYYITDSISDTNAIIHTDNRTIVNGNCTRTTDWGIREYTHYTDKINTLNYGNAFFGKMDKNPVHKIIFANSELTMTYQYLDEKIHKVDYESRNTRGAKSDTTYVSVEAPVLSTYFSYVAR